MNLSGARLAPGNVCLVISSYRSDEPVLDLLGRAYHLVPTTFSRVIVVDSQGSGKIAEKIEKNGWDWVDYYNAPSNLGSAGNLFRRLEIAASCPELEYAFAINHDGELNRDTIKLLIDVAAGHSKIGAVYPLRCLVNQGGKYDISGRHWLPLRRKVVAAPCWRQAKEVYWSSSNGALYSLEPIRLGIRPDPKLWMCWEDLGYGWTLERAGYVQLMAAEAKFNDTYEFSKLRGVNGSVSLKPSWYAYYVVRNLILIARRTRAPFKLRFFIWRRILLELVLNLTVRKQRRQRVLMFGRGLIDGCRGRDGMRVIP